MNRMTTFACKILRSTTFRLSYSPTQSIVATHHTTRTYEKHFVIPPEAQQIISPPPLFHPPPPSGADRCIIRPSASRICANDECVRTASTLSTQSFPCCDVSRTRLWRDVNINYSQQPLTLAHTTASPPSTPTLFVCLRSKRQSRLHACLPVFFL